MSMMKRFLAEEEGMGTVEIVMIIAALMVIALLFREEITKFAENIMKIVFDESVIEAPSIPE